MKSWKQKVNRAFRRISKQLIDQGEYDSAPERTSEVRSEYDAPSDGKSYWEDMPEKGMRK